MIEADNPIDNDDPFDLHRFVSAQEGTYSRAISELRSGRKESHWMWFIFPQFDGLGMSSTSKHYSIKSAEEARHYLDHPLLGKRLVECAETLLGLQGRSASQIFGYPDDLKLKSSMTLFAEVARDEETFARVIDRYFNGERDRRTLELMRSADE